MYNIVRRTEGSRLAHGLNPYYYTRIQFLLPTSLSSMSTCSGTESMKYHAKGELNNAVKQYTDSSSIHSISNQSNQIQ